MQSLLGSLVVTKDREDAGVQRLDAITGLRWWAALAVFGQHVVNLVSVSPALLPVLGFGHLGVNFFFVLSGFVLTWSWRRGVDRRTFYWRRFARIYPLHLVTLAMAIPIFYRFSSPPGDQSWVKGVDMVALVLCVFLVQGWSRDPDLLFAGNPASWTLTVEAFFYALFPFAIPAVARLGRRSGLLAVLALIALLFALRGLTLMPATAGVARLPLPLLHLPEFLAGMTLAQAFRMGWRPRVHPVIPAVAITIWVVGLSTLQVHGSPAATTVGAFSGEVVTALCALLIASVASHELRGHARLMRARPLVALGEWSFAFYLIHAILIYAALEAFGRQTGSGPRSIAWVALVLAASIALSWALHVLLERPVEKRLRDWQRGRRAVQPLRDR